MEKRSIKITTTKEVYRKHFFEAFDLAINSIKDRFDQPDFKTYEISQQVLLKSARNDTYDDEVSSLLEFYDTDFNGSLLRSRFDEKDWSRKCLSV